MQIRNVKIEVYPDIIINLDKSTKENSSDHYSNNKITFTQFTSYNNRGRKLKEIEFKIYSKEHFLHNGKQTFREILCNDTVESFSNEIRRDYEYLFSNEKFIDRKISNYNYNSTLKSDISSFINGEISSLYISSPYYDNDAQKMVAEACVINRIEEIISLLKLKKKVYFIREN